jgi:hypothetical protein
MGNSCWKQYSTEVDNSSSKNVYYKPATPEKQQVRQVKKSKTVVEMEVSGCGGTRLPPALPSLHFHEEESRSNAGDRPPYSGGSVAHAVRFADNTWRTLLAVQNA